MAPKLGPQARVVYAALVERGTAEEVAERTGLIAKSAGPHCSDLVKMGLVEVVDHALNARGKKVKVFQQAPPERVDEARAAAGPKVARELAESEGRTRRKALSTFDVRMRKQFVRELFKDSDLLQALADEKAKTKAEKHARRHARDEIRARERLAQTLLRQERQAREAGDPLLPFWSAWRKFSAGADAARFLVQLLERDVDLAAQDIHPPVEPRMWRENEWQTKEMLRVTGILHAALHKAFNFDLTACPACGALPSEQPTADVIDGSVVLEELLSLEAGES